MKKPLWFKRKRYGWGWYPATWQGWLTLGGFLTLIGLNGWRIDNASQSVNERLLNFVPQTTLLVVALVGMCYLTGEKPRWQWGDEKKR